MTDDRKELEPSREPDPGETNRGSTELESVGASWIGPLPPPNILAGFEELVPGSADRIIRLTENEQSHRVKIESKAVETHNLQVKWGHANTLAVIIACVALAKPAPYVAIALAVLLAIGTIASIFTGPKTPA